ncbi:hypothetical protein ACSBR2_006144 [Camellia fascicularis]
MWFTGNRRLMHSSLAVFLLMISLIHIWACCDCRVGAIRTFPQNSVVKERETQRVKATNKKNQEEEDLFQKYFFNGSASQQLLNSSSGFEQSKRTVPSCPDHLHNK